MDFDEVQCTSLPKYKRIEDLANIRACDVEAYLSPPSKKLYFNANTEVSRFKDQ